MQARSRKAILAEEFLRTHGRKRLLAKREGMEAALALAAQINELPYEIPKNRLISAEELTPFAYPIRMPVEKHLLHGMEVFLFHQKAQNANGATPWTRCRPPISPWPGRPGPRSLRRTR